MHVEVGGETREVCPGVTESFELSSPIVAAGYEARAEAKRG